MPQLGHHLPGSMSPSMSQEYKVEELLQSNKDTISKRMALVSFEEAIHTIYTIKSIYLYKGEILNFKLLRILLYFYIYCI